MKTRLSCLYGLQVREKERLSSLHGLQMSGTNVNMNSVKHNTDTAATKQTQEQKGTKKMNILNCDVETENNRVLKYKLTTSPEIQKMSTLDGQRIDINHFCIYQDLKTSSNGEEKETIVLSIMTREGELFATNSKTMIEDFENIVDFFGDDLVNGGTIPVRIISGISKNNRTYYTMTYAD